MIYCAMLANDKNFLQLFLERFPKEKMDLEFHFFKDTRMENHTSLNDIKKLVSDSANPNFSKSNCFFHNGKDVLKTVYENQDSIGVHISKEAKEFFLNYVLAIKLVFLPFMNFINNKIEKVLFLDDDVVVEREFVDLVERNTAFAGPEAFLKFGDTDKNREEFSAYADVIGLNITLEQFRKFGGINSGVLLLTLSDDIKEKLSKLFNHEYFINRYNSFKDKESKHNSLFFTEQKFYWFYFVKNLYGVLRSHHYKGLNGKFEKFSPPKAVRRKSTFIHYCAGSHKYKYLDYLRDEMVYSEKLLPDYAEDLFPL